MAEYGLAAFIADARRASAGDAAPADCVTAIAPLMLRLLAGDRSFLEERHFRADPDHYARNAVHVAADSGPSLYALVWCPGQWTPVHDHGTWGVVGIVDGVLEEQAMIRTDPHGSPQDAARDGGIRLARGGLVLLTSGAVTTFVPNPDHIHRTGVAANRGRAVSLHLYGRTLDSFHVYDAAAGTRRRIEVTHG